MAGSTQLRLACHNGWLVITDERVALVPRGLLRRKPLWTIQRAAVAGTSLRREPKGYMMALRTRAGTDLPVVRLHPADALRLVKLLGYAPALLAPTREAGQHQSGIMGIRCKGGRIEVSKDAIAFVPGVGLRRTTPWRIERERISGVSCLRLPGARLRHDVELHLKDGRALRIERLPASMALGLLHLLGYVPGTPPAQPLAQREALDMHFVAEESDEGQEQGRVTIRTSPHAPARRAVLRDLDELWRQQQTGQRYHPVAG